MKNKFLLLVISISMLLILKDSFASVIDIIPTPAETIVLKLPNRDYVNWKEIAKTVNTKQRSVDFIPKEQLNQNYSELIRLQYYDFSNRKDASNITIDSILDRIQETVVSGYSGSKIDWKILEKNKNDIMYEWVLYDSRNIPTQHEIVRIFFKNEGFHAVEFTHKNSELPPDERNQWISLLKNSVSIISYAEANNIHDSLSLTSNIKQFLNLGQAFQNWIVLEKHLLSDGGSHMNYIHPPKANSNRITDCLKVVSRPNVNFLSIDQLFEKNKKETQKESKEEVKFHILNKKPNEIVYAFSYPMDEFQYSEIVRIFISNNVSHSVSYLGPLPENMKHEENFQLWQKKLETIQVQLP